VVRTEVGLRQHYAGLATKTVDPKALAAERNQKGYRKRQPSMPHVTMDEETPPRRRKRVLSPAHEPEAA
jgi:hypothetical protein